MSGSPTPPHPPLLAPSILAGDHAHLGASARRAAEAGASWLHLDIMDGHFVPNLTFGPETLAALRRTGSKLFFDTHLMLDQPDRYLEAFIRAGADLVSIHIEPAYDHGSALARIRELGARNGIVLNPDTPAEVIEPFLDRVDLVLVMTVQPGFGGQAFRTDMIPKLAQLDDFRRRHGYSWRLEVDGGIDREQARECRQAGADTFVAGTSFYRSEDPAAFVAEVQAL